MYVAAPASDQAYDHALRHRQQQHASKKTAKHVDDRSHDDRIQARTADVTSGPGRPPSLLISVLLLCVTLVTLDVRCLPTTPT